VLDWAEVLHVASGAAVASACTHAAGHWGRQQQRLAEATAAQLDEHTKQLGRMCLASGT
jgi:hypothetical protein